MRPRASTGFRKIATATIMTAAMGPSVCSSDQVIDNSVGFVAGTTKVVAKGAVGAEKLTKKRRLDDRWCRRLNQ
jgi:hypothetical protein